MNKFEELTSIKNQLLAFESELNAKVPSKDPLHQRVLEFIEEVENTLDTLTDKEDVEPCDKVIKKCLIASGNLEEVCRLDIRNLFRGGERATIQARIDCLNRHYVLTQPGITLSLAPGEDPLDSSSLRQSSPTSNRYRFGFFNRQLAIIDTNAELSTLTVQNLAAVDFNDIEGFRRIVWSLRTKNDRYRATRNALEAELDLLRANISSLLVDESDLVRLEELRSLYLGENRGNKKDCIFDYVNMIAKIRDDRIRNERKKNGSGTAQEQLIDNTFTPFIDDPGYKQMAIDWADGGKYDELYKKLLEAIQLGKDREENINSNPKILKEHKDELEDGVYDENELDLPYAEQGEGDESMIDSNDVDQGAVGDCYYLSSISAIAQSNSELFELGHKDCIIKEDGNDYIVTLYLRTDKTTLDRQPTDIKVSKETLVNKDGNSIYAGQGDGELWVILLEKAYAQAMGGFENIVGGYSEHAMEMLTGKNAERLSISDFSEENLQAKLREIEQNNQAAAFSSKGTGEKELTVKQANGADATLFQGHAYTFESIDEAGNVSLQNPHGQNHLYLTTEAVKEYFIGISVLEEQ